ncbi:MAG TPA: DedA family protein [Ktedonobacterales bacterium]
MQFLPELTHGLLHFLHAYGLLALFALILVEEAGVPLPAPGDTLIALAGAQPHRTLAYTTEALAACTLAVFIGSSILYWLMRYGGHSFIARYGRYLHLKQERLDRIEGWIEKRGTLAIILGRLIPGLRIPTTVICGLTGVPYRVFGPSTALAGLVWSSIYFLLGELFQKRIGLIAAYITGLLDTLGDSTTLTLLALALLLALGLGVWGLTMRRSRARRAAAEAEVTAKTEVAAETTTRS